LFILTLAAVFLTIATHVTWRTGIGTSRTASRPYHRDFWAGLAETTGNEQLAVSKGPSRFQRSL